MNMQYQSQFSTASISKELTEEEAKKMIKAYRTHPKRLETDGGYILEGLIVKIEDFEKLLEVQSGDTQRRITTQAQKFIIMFAVSLDDLYPIPKLPSKQNFTTIIAPIDKYNEINKKLLKNVFDPCPDTDGKRHEINNYEDFLK